MRFRVLIAVSVCVPVLSFIGCRAAVDSEQRDTTTGAPTVESSRDTADSTLPSPCATTHPASDPQGDGCDESPAGRYDGAGPDDYSPEQFKLISFGTPDGNIGCELTQEPGRPAEGRCDIQERTWEFPASARPESCPSDSDWGQGAAIRDGRSQPVCAGDTALGVSKGLEGTERPRLGSVYCFTRNDGVKCIDERTNHGFFVSRRGYELF